MTVNKKGDFVLQVFILDVSNYIKFLSKKEIDILKKFFSKVLLHYIFTIKYGLKSKKIFVQKSKNGKLYLRGCYKNIFFNISHSKGLIAIAISNSEIGIDVENIKGSAYLKNIDKYDLVFQKKEIDFIKLAKNKYIAFYKIWTLKESIVKLLDKNLGYMDKFSIFNFANSKLVKLQNLTFVDKCGNLYLFSVASLKHFQKPILQKIDFEQLLLHIKFSKFCKLFVKDCLKDNFVSFYEILVILQSIFNRGGEQYGKFCFKSSRFCN